MRELIEELLSQFDIGEIPRGTTREVELPRIARKADAVIGMRRSGKTWRLFQEIHRTLEAGVHPQDILYLNFEDERLQPMMVSDLHWITEVFNQRRASAGRGKGETHFFFDEVQNVEGWERWIRRLLDQETPNIVITGSSGKLLSQEIATSLRGRSLPTELLPFSFAEMLRHRGIEIPRVWPPSGEIRRRLGSELQTYLTEGGFPEIQDQPTQIRARILQDYINVVLLRDVAERHGVENFTALRYLQRALLSRPSNRFSIHKLYNDLKSQGVQVGKSTLYEYLEHLEDAYLLFTVTIEARSLRVRQSNPRKVYPVDQGLSAAVSLQAGADLGHMLETVVYLELRRRGNEMTWLRTKAGHEVDFFVRGLAGERLLVQVAADMSAESTRKREVRALQEAMTEHQFDSAVIVTLWDHETIEVEQGSIRVVPAWRWLLEDRGI